MTVMNIEGTNPDYSKGGASQIICRRRDEDFVGGEELEAKKDKLAFWLSWHSLLIFGLQRRTDAD